MINNLPIYRAKKIDSDEYVEGYLTRSRCYSGRYILPVDFNKDDNISGYEEEIIEIDTTTVSIHFPDMLAKDSNRYLPNGEKDLRIFASLQKNGKGGDIVKYSDYIERYTMLFSSFSGTRAVSFDLKLKSRINAGLKIVGIQE